MSLRVPEVPREELSGRHSGLGHRAFTASGPLQLQRWKTPFETLGVEHSVIRPLAAGEVMVVRDPGNIQLEVYAPPDSGGWAVTDTQPASGSPVTVTRRPTRGRRAGQ